MLPCVSTTSGARLRVRVSRRGASRPGPRELGAGGGQPPPRILLPAQRRCPWPDVIISSSGLDRSRHICISRPHKPSVAPSFAPPAGLLRASFWPLSGLPQPHRHHVPHCRSLGAQAAQCPHDRGCRGPGPASARGGHLDRLQPGDVVRRLPRPRHAAVGPAPPQPAAAARRAALHRPAPGRGALAQAAPSRAALRPRPARHRRARPRAQAAGARQARAEAARRAVGRPRHPHPQRVRADPAVPRDELGLPELAVPRRRVPARQQERRHGPGLRALATRARRAAAPAR